MNLRAKLILVAMGTALLLTLPLLFITPDLVDNRLLQSAEAEAERALHATQEALMRGEPAQDVARDLAANRGLRIQVLDPNRTIVADSAVDPTGRVSPYGRDLPDLGEHVVFEDRRTEGHRALTAYAQSERGEIVVVRRSLRTLAGSRERLIDLVQWAAILSLVFSGLWMSWIAGWLVAPLSRAAAVANALAEGDLDARTAYHGSDELGTLGRAIDRLGEVLSGRQRSIRSEEARLRAVLDAMVEGVFVTDATGHIVLSNRAFDRLAGRNARGNTPMEAVRSPELHEAVLAARRGEAREVVIKTGAPLDTRSLAALVAPLGDDAGVVAVLHDITALLRADRVRRDFVANASHELRTPLTAIRGFAETLRDGALDDPQTAQRFLDTILKHTLRLERLVDDMLTLSRAESSEGELDMKPIDVGKIAEEVVASLEVTAQERRIALSLTPADDAIALGDESSVEEILVNLVDNALKYTPPEGRVRLTVIHRDDEVIVEVADTGPGISDEHRERIFERFYRVDAGRSREVGGTGLGLSIVRHLSAQLGGSVTVESEVGRGSTFRLRLRRPA